MSDQELWANSLEIAKRESKIKSTTSFSFLTQKVEASKLYICNSDNPLSFQKAWTLGEAFPQTIC